MSGGGAVVVGSNKVFHHPLIARIRGLCAGDKVRVMEVDLLLNVAQWGRITVMIHGSESFEFDCLRVVQKLVLALVMLEPEASLHW